MLKYNNTTNLITTDDITLGGNINPNLGKDLSEILNKQAEEIQELRSNIKWITKHGGIGGSSTGTGGSDSAVSKTKYLITITYTDKFGYSTLVTANHKNTSITPILAKPGTKVSINITVTSVMLSTISYSAIMLLNGNSNSKVIPTLTKYTEFNFIATDSSYTCNLIINGETTGTLQFGLYTQIFNSDIKLVSGNASFINNSSIESAYISNLKLDTTVNNLIPELFTLKFKSASINGTTINTDLNLLISVSNIFSLYGLYNLLVSFLVINNSTLAIADDIQINYMYVYKESDKIFIYVYSDDINIYNKDNIANPIGTNLRSIPLKFKIYGRQTDTVLTSYKLWVKTSKDAAFIENDTLYTVNLEYSYFVENKSTSEDYEKLAITFKQPNSNDEINYYIWVKSAGNAKYIFTKNDDNKCYGSKGDNTDSVSYNGTISFPTKTLGARYWQFSNNSNNILRINSSCIPAGSILSNDTTVFNNITSFISGNIATSTSSIYYDTIINIGINYKDSSYNTPVITLNDGASTPSVISIYRNKIVYDKGTTDKFGLPDDAKFHLITIYFKQKYDINVNSSNTWSTPSLSFAIYIDGVLDVKPTDTQFLISNKTKCTFSTGSTQYNFFGIDIINPVTTNSTEADNNYSAIVKRYICDYDPILVSNYYMCYANIHYADLGYTKEPYTIDLLKVMDRSLYSSLSNDVNSYINYYNTDNNIYNKFIPIDISILLKMMGNSTMPMYRIVPVYSDTSSVKNGLHKSIADTLESYGETDTGDFKTGWECEFLKYDSVNNEWKSIVDSHKINGVTHLPKFRIKYQGSSTLLYSVKNFEISTDKVEDVEKGLTYNYYFNPDSTTFKYPELSYNLKADLVDSSSCTNNVIGNFINQYMTSPFGENYKACLSGRPILLFISNNKGNTDSEADTLFLGIYNMNLNRDSLNNLGYQKLPENLDKILSSTFEDIYYSVTDNNTQITATSGTVVAEIQGNGNEYDLSQYDLGLLLNVYGNFYVVDNGKISDNYSTALLTMSRDFASYVKGKILTYSGNNVFTRNDYGLTDVNNYTNKYTELKNIYGNRLYYYNGTELTSIPTDSIIVTTNSIRRSTFLSYKQKDSLDYSIVGNIDYQFHLLYDKNGENITELNYKNNTYYYVENTNHQYNPEVHKNILDLRTSLKYYMTCMAFAMVDSVQKNLNIKRPNNGTTWYPLFYDMDTALALDNAGGNSNYKAFSDYIDDLGKIISDYVGENEEAWFDTASSYLFMYAKYDARLNHNEDGDALRYVTPLEYWLTLRGVTANNSDLACEGALKDVDTFCNKYLYKYLDNNIPPLIWNLNYMYKYFSFTKNIAQEGSEETADTEDRRFNGRMIYRRKTWLNQRFHYLDALFGIMNQRTIGKSGVTISELISKPTGNTDVELTKTIFPHFNKGITSKAINAVVKDEPRTPIIVLTGTGEYTLYITDDAGSATITNNLTANDDIGFYGTTHLSSISDCGLFLVHANEENTITGDQITNIDVKTSCSDVTINLSSVESAKEIIIGNQSSSISIARSIKIVGTEDKPEIKIVINNIKCPDITISNCILSSDSIISNITPINTQLNLTLTNVTINGYLNIENSNVYNINITSCIFKDNVFINGQLESNLKIISSNNLSNKEFKLDISKLKTINIENSAIHNFRHLSSLQLTECNVEFTNNISSDTEFCLNYNNAQEGAISKIDASSSNQFLTEISFTRTDTKYGNSIHDITLRLPLFAVLTNFNLTGLFTLGKGGIAGSIVDGITIANINSNTNGIIKLALNADWAFAMTKCSFNGLTESNTIELLTLLFLNTTSANFLMHLRSKALSLTECLGVLGAIKAANKTCSIEGLFSNTNITGFSNNPASMNTILNLIAEVYPTNATNRGRLVFYKSNLQVLNKNLASKLGKVFSSYMSGSTNLIESGALKDFTIIWESESSSYRKDNNWEYTHHCPSTYFYTYNDTVSLVTDIKYAEEFAKALSLRISIVVNSTISFDFGEGMGSNIRTYGGISWYNTNTNNFKNIQNMFNNTTNLSSISNDFLNLSRVDLDNENVVDLYKFLVNENNFNTATINSKAYNIICCGNPSNTTMIQVGSFTKKISITLFSLLLSILARDKKNGNISNIFLNCYITGATEDSFKEAIKYKVGLFNSLACSFMNCSLLSSSLEQVPMNLNNAFAIEKTVTEDNEDSTTTKTIIIKSNITTNLIQAFLNCYLAPFEEIAEYDSEQGMNTNSNYGLAIANNKVVYGLLAFYNCIYNYPNYTETMPTSEAQYKASIENFSLPTDAQKRTLLPKNFLTFCKKDSSSTTYLIFSNSGYNNKHLTGYLPEVEIDGTRSSTTNYFGSGISINDSFINCNIYYHQIENNKFTIFPSWFCNFSKGNSKFIVYIPLPLTNTAGGEENYRCSIFGYNNDIIFEGNYGTLPKYPPLLSTWSTYTATGYVGITTPLYLTLESNGELPCKGNIFKYIIPIQIAPSISIGTNSTVVTDVTSKKSSNQYKPIHELNTGLTRNNIFRGVLSSTGRSTLDEVLSF